MNMKLNKILKTGLLTSTLTLSICQADKIEITSFSEWSQADPAGKLTYLNKALEKMKEKDTGEKHYRLVITEDEKDGWVFSGAKGRVYLSDKSGETSASQIASYVKGNSAYAHNLSTHKALLELYKTVLEANETVEEQAIQDSLDLLLPFVHNDVQASYQDLLGKDMKAEQLQAIVEHVSVPHVLCIQAKPVPLEPSEMDVSSVKEKSEKIKKPVIRGSAIMKFVHAGNERDEKAKEEAEILKKNQKK